MELKNIPNIDILKNLLIARAEDAHKNKKILPCGSKKSIYDCFTLEIIIRKQSNLPTKYLMFWYNVEGVGTSYNISQEVSYDE